MCLFYVENLLLMIFIPLELLDVFNIAEISAPILVNAVNILNFLLLAGLTSLLLNLWLSHFSLRGPEGICALSSIFYTFTYTDDEIVPVS